MSLTTIGELEAKIFGLYSEIATIPLPDFHKLMKEYSGMLIALKEDRPELLQLKERFLAKVKGLPIQVKYIGEPTTDVYGHVWSVSFPEELQRYADCTLIHFHMPPGDRHPHGQKYVGGQTVSIANSPNY